MINKKKIDELFNTISSDLSIFKFADESEISFKNRLTYSAISKWILELFSDRDIEKEAYEKNSNDDYEKISKSHVTISALNILNSYKKIVTELNDYFINDNKFINCIEDIYIRLGYVKSGMFSFKLQDRTGKIAIGDESLIIDANSKVNKVRGLGLWGKHSNLDIPLANYLLINTNADDYALNMISQLKYNIFEYEHGRCDIYDNQLHMWIEYSPNLARKFKYSVVKIDDGLDYKILKCIDDEIYAGSLPEIYTKGKNDFYFYHDIWRIILGICSLNGCKAMCQLMIKEDYIKVKFQGFILPLFEDALLRCIAWPLKNCLNVSEFITDISMKKTLIELLSKFCVDIVEA